MKDGRQFNNPYKNLNDEERLAKVEQMMSQFKGKRGRPAGLPDGMKLIDLKLHKLCIKYTANRLLEEIIVNNNLDATNTDDALAIEALKTAVNIMRLDCSLKDQLAASKLILEYTKAKPSIKSEVTVHTAEDFLAQVLKDEGRD